MMLTGVSSDVSGNGFSFHRAKYLFRIGPRSRVFVSLEKWPLTGQSKGMVSFFLFNDVTRNETFRSRRMEILISMRGLDFSTSSKNSAYVVFHAGDAFRKNCAFTRF